MTDNIYYNKGKKAKQIVGIYRNPYLANTWEHQQWKLGFDQHCYEPLDFSVELEDCSAFFEKYEPVNIVPSSINTKEYIT